VSEPQGGEVVDITHKGVVHLLFLGGPFFTTRDDKIVQWNKKKYKWYFVDTQAMTPDGDYIVCRTRFERILDANTFIWSLKDNEEVQLAELHETVSPIYLEQGKTPEEEEAERKHNIIAMCDEIASDDTMTTTQYYEIVERYFDTKYIRILDEINRKYPKPKYREFLKTSEAMENYGKFQREV
tara:strand:- start:1141 stop:1689 length:549 start_codon:yes stop_codon:yes gene_type:complete